MKIILRKNFDKLGQVGDIIEVKDGYARNYLIPKQIAYVATPGCIRALEEEKKQLAKKSEKELAHALLERHQHKNKMACITVVMDKMDAPESLLKMAKLMAQHNQYSGDKLR